MGVAASGLRRRGRGVARARQDTLAVAEDHFSDLDRLVIEALPDREIEELQVARFEQMVFDLVVGLDRHVEKSSELVVRLRSAPSDNVRGNRVGGTSELRPQVSVPQSPEVPRRFCESQSPTCASVATP
jgi:hypothetical protein